MTRGWRTVSATLLALLFAPGATACSIIGPVSEVNAFLSQSRVYLMVAIGLAAIVLVTELVAKRRPILSVAMIGALAVHHYWLATGLAGNCSAPSHQLSVVVMALFAVATLHSIYRLAKR